MDGRRLFFTNFGIGYSIKLVLFNPKQRLMNYPVTTTSSRELLTFLFRMSIVVLLVFFIGFFLVEAFSFLKLFEVTVVANPAMNLIK